MNLEVLAASDTAVVADSAGSVWHIRGKDDALRVRSPDGDIVTLLRASPTGHFVVIGTAAGHVSILDSNSWRQVAALEMNGPLRQAAFSHDDILALASERHDLRILFLRPSIITRMHDTSLDARDISFSPDGQVLAIVCADGRTWFHQLADDGWTYVRDHYALTSFGRFSSDGAFFASSDATGLVVLRDVLKTLSHSH
jgi:WD40 repeat protein